MEQHKESRFWWHWQNLKEDNPKAWLYGRAWLHQRPRGQFEFGWCIPSHSARVEVTFGGNHQLQISLSCWLLALYFTFEQWAWLRRWKACEDWHGKETSFALHSWAFWWRLWLDENEWHSKTPKWRDGCFHIDNFFLGKNEYTKVDQPPIPVVIPLPEGNYPAKVVLFSQTWKRPRWPLARYRTGATVDIEDGGIPVPGKGENAWDCDDDAFSSIGTSATTVEASIADAIRSVNRTRERYGGKGWLPVKQKKSNEEEAM
jgi:hypothetical protein